MLTFTSRYDIKVKGQGLTKKIIKLNFLSIFNNAEKMFINYIETNYEKNSVVERPLIT